MQDTARPDVLVPVYNTPKIYLKKALDSILGLEGLGRVLIYDDASTDSTTKEVIEEYVKTHPGQVLAYTGATNQGPGFARNFLLRRSQAEFVLFHDSDDMSKPQRLTELLKLAEHESAPVLISSDHKTQRRGKRGQVLWGDYTVTRRFLEHGFPMRFSGFMVRRQAIIDAGVWYPQGVYLNEEVIFAQRVAAAFPFRLAVLNKELWEALSAPDSLTTQAHPKHPRNFWVKPGHFYLHHSMVANLQARKSPVQETKWAERLGVELTAAYTRLVLGMPEIKNARYGAPPNAFIDPAQSTNKAERVAEGDGHVPLDAGAIHSPDKRPDDGAVVYFGHDIKEHHRWIEGWAAEHGKRYEFIKIDWDFYKKAAPKLKRASFVVIWNGCQSNARNATAICEKMQIPTCYFEWGIQPQSETFLVDLEGMVNRSMMMKPLSWVTEEDIAAFEAGMKPIREEHPLKPERNRVLIPLQIENDTQVIYGGHWRNMAEFVQYVEFMYPGHDIVIRPHPKSGNQFGYKGHKNSRIIVEGKNKATFLEAAARSEVVIGLNSTSLVEAAMLGVPTIALGDCPLRVQPLRHRQRLLAAYWALRVKRSGSIGDVLKRFPIKPLD